MVKRIILVGFDNDALSDMLMGSDIHKWKYTHNTKTDICLREYAHYFTQLYNNSWVFFDNIFGSIEQGIIDNNNIENAEKIRESGIMDCYPVLIHRVNDLLNELQWCLIISNIENNRYDYLIELLDCKKLYLWSETEVVNYINHCKR